MARRATVGTGSAGAVRTVLVLVAILVLALFVLLVLRARPQTEPFDPSSGEPLGGRALVLTLQDAGADVSSGSAVPAAGDIDSTRILVWQDRLNDDQRQDVLDFVAAGGVAIVADPESTLHGGAGPNAGAIEVGAAPRDRALRDDPLREANIEAGRCTIGALDGLRGVFAVEGWLFPVSPSERRCFTAPRGLAAPTHSFVIVREVGDGVIVGLGDNKVFVNRDLRVADNAGLAVALLAPNPGSRVAIVIGSEPLAQPIQEVGAGEDTLIDLVPPWVWMVLVFACVGFVLYAAAQSNAIGRSYPEPLPTPIAASELVSATGNLMQRANHSHRAGEVLRDRLRRDLSLAYSVPLTAPDAELDHAVTSRTELAPGSVADALSRNVANTAALVALSSHIAHVRQAALGEPDDHSDLVSDPTAPERAPQP